LVLFIFPLFIFLIINLFLDFYWKKYNVRFVLLIFTSPSSTHTTLSSIFTTPECLIGPPLGRLPHANPAQTSICDHLIGRAGVKD